MGLALILDNTVVFCYRLTRRTWCDDQSRHWPLLDSGISDRVVGKGSYSYVAVLYSYAVSSQISYGSYRRPFWTSLNAYDYGRNIAGAKTCNISYKPADPSQSVFREADQPSRF